MRHIVGLMAVALAGCSDYTDYRPAAQPLQGTEGLTLATDRHFLRGTYSKHGEIIYFETRVAPKQQHVPHSSDNNQYKWIITETDETVSSQSSVERSGPGDVYLEKSFEQSSCRYDSLKGTEPSEDESSPYEVDVRFLDRNGSPFLVQVGGHAYIDSKWRDEDTAQDFEVLPERRAIDFDLVRALGKELSSLDLPNHSHELRVLSQLADSIDEQDSDPTLGYEHSAGHEKEQSAAPTASYNHKITIKKKAAFNCSFCGDHSAVLLQIYYSSGSLYKQISTSNHGTAATDSSMSNACSKTFTYSTTATPLLQYPCTTSYGFTSGYHVCNDDTYCQYYDVKNGANSSWVTCGDSSLRAYAPSCG